MMLDKDAFARELQGAHVCEESSCEEWATHFDSVPDKNVQGINHGECGYRIAFYCTFHARERKESIGNTSRMTPIAEEGGTNESVYQPKSLETLRNEGFDYAKRGAHGIENAAIEWRAHDIRHALAIASRAADVEDMKLAAHDALQILRIAIDTLARNERE